jgi:hypothetical protein
MATKRYKTSERSTNILLKAVRPSARHCTASSFLGRLLPGSKGARKVAIRLDQPSGSGPSDTDLGSRLTNVQYHPESGPNLAEAVSLASAPTGLRELARPSLPTITSISAAFRGEGHAPIFPARFPLFDSSVDPRGCPSHRCLCWARLASTHQSLSSSS